MVQDVLWSLAHGQLQHSSDVVKSTILTAGAREKINLLRDCLAQKYAFIVKIGGLSIMCATTLSKMSRYSVTSPKILNQIVGTTRHMVTHFYMANETPTMETSARPINLKICWILPPHNC